MRGPCSPATCSPPVPACDPRLCPPLFYSLVHGLDNLTPLGLWSTHHLTMLGTNRRLLAGEPEGTCHEHQDDRPCDRGTLPLRVLPLRRGALSFFPPPPPGPAPSPRPPP